MRELRPQIIRNSQVSVAHGAVERPIRASFRSVRVQPLEHLEATVSSCSVHSSHRATSVSVCVKPLDHAQVAVCRSSVHSSLRAGRFLNICVQPLHHLQMPITRSLVHCIRRASFVSIGMKPFQYLKVSITCSCIEGGACSCPPDIGWFDTSSLRRRLAVSARVHQWSVLVVKELQSVQVIILGGFNYHLLNRLPTRIHACRAALQ